VPYRGGEQAAVRADLGELAAGGQRESVAPGVGGVEDPQPVACRAHLRHRPRRPVDQDDVAEHPLHPWPLDTGHLAQRPVDRRIPERPVRLERAVADHQRQFALARGKPERVLLVVAHQVEAGEPAVDLRAGEVHPVVVVPERRRPLVHRVGVLPHVDGDVTAVMRRRAQS
jgi:hypothetical protein